MESVAEEEFLEFRATLILIRSEYSAVGVGVDCQNDTRRVSVCILEEFHKPGGVQREAYVQVYAGNNNIMGPTVEDHDRTVPMTKMRDLLGFKEMWGVYRGPWTVAGGREDIKTPRTGEAVAWKVWLLQ